MKRQTYFLLSVLIVGLGASVLLARGIDARRPPADPNAIDESLYLNPTTARRMSLGFNGLVADWYWMRSLQYVGKKIINVDQNVPIDSLADLNLKLLAPLLDTATTLDPQFMDPYEYAAVVLPGVDVEHARRGALGEPIGDRRDRLHDASLVVDVHHAGEQRVRPDGRAHLVRVHGAPRIGRGDDGHAEAAAFQLANRLQHRVVLDGRRDEVPAWAWAVVTLLRAGGLGQTEDGQVVALGRAAREHDVAAGGVDHGRDLLASLFDGPAGAAAVVVRAAAGVAELVVQKAQHRLPHARVEGRGRGAVEIDSHARFRA